MKRIRTREIRNQAFNCFQLQFSQDLFYKLLQLCYIVCLPLIPVSFIINTSWGTRECLSFPLSPCQGTGADTQRVPTNPSVGPKEHSDLKPEERKLKRNSILSLQRNCKKRATKERTMFKEISITHSRSMYCPQSAHSLSGSKLISRMKLPSKESNRSSEIGIPFSNNKFHERDPPCKSHGNKVWHICVRIPTQCQHEGQWLTAWQHMVKG